MAMTYLGGCEYRAAVAFYVIGEMHALECADMGADAVGKAFRYCSRWPASACWSGYMCSPSLAAKRAIWFSCWARSRFVEVSKRSPCSRTWRPSWCLCSPRYAC